MIGKSTRPGFMTVTPYITVQDIEGFLVFLNKAFQAEETDRGIGGAGGLHVELRIGDSMLMAGGGAMVEEPQTAMLFLYVEDVDAVYQSAIAAGATELQAPTDGMFGEKRGAGVMDPFGNQWFFGRHEPNL